MKKLLVLMVVGLFFIGGAAMPTVAADHPWFVSGAGDGDRDGVIDYDDKCPGTKYCCGVDDKGCPLDEDQDGVCEPVYDKCPGTPLGAKVDAQGCPMDTDGDGVYDGIDQCPGTPAGVKVDAKGCPIALDSDGDGVLDPDDKCPDTPKGLKVDSDGCPIPVFMNILVYFDLDRDNIKREYVDGLQRLAAFMAKYPKTVVTLAGHTDSRGTVEYNQGLSYRRAVQVRNYLHYTLGVDADRLQVRAYGETDPAYPNDSEFNMAKNRRVECTVSKTFAKK